MGKVIHINFNNLSEDIATDRVREKAMCIIEKLVREKHNLMQENNILKKTVRKNLSSIEEKLFDMSKDESVRDIERIVQNVINIDKENKE